METGTLLTELQRLMMVIILQPGAPSGSHVSSISCHRSSRDLGNDQCNQFRVRCDGGDILPVVYGFLFNSIPARRLDSTA
jgi:hypothetical protein